MTTFDSQLSRIDAATLEALMENSVREGSQLEYKEQLPGGKDTEKTEFLADVTAFANAAGGDLIYGIQKRCDATGVPTGEPGRIVGLPGINLDSERLRLEHLLRDGVAPRLPRVEFHEIPRDAEPPCLLLRVPRSWMGLHRVIFKNHGHFYSRNSGGKFQLDVTEIRQGFLAAETLRDRLHRFRLDRISHIIALETPVPSGPGPKLIFHALPFDSCDVWSRIAPMSDAEIAGQLGVIGGQVHNWRFNLDGVVVWSQARDPRWEQYTQLFRDGAIEAVSGAVLAIDAKRGGFYGTSIEEEVIKALNRYRELWGRVGLSAPLVLGLTLAGVRGQKVLPGQEPWREIEDTIDRDLLILPEVMVQDISRSAATLLSPVFDMLWSAGGWRGSPRSREGSGGTGATA